MSRPYNGFTTEQRANAGKWYREQLRSGARSRPDICQCCGQTKWVSGHSEDYSEPFGDHIGAFALCYRCHMAVHCRHKNWRAFAAYRDLIKDRTFELPTSFLIFWQDFIHLHEKVRFASRPVAVERTWLDDLCQARDLASDKSISAGRSVSVARDIKVKQQNLF